MDRLRVISPWIDHVLYDFSKHIFSDYNTEVLDYFHRQIDREIRIISANPDEYKATALFTALRDLYHHYTFKITSSGQNCPNVKRSCVVLLSQLIKVGLILSKGNICSLWINRILTTISLFSGKPCLVNEALFLINNLKFKYHKPYFEILNHVLTSENKGCITEPLMYMEVILLYRRMKAITKSGYHRACVTSLAAKIKPPINLITWLYSLVGNQEFKSELKYVSVSKQLMRNKISKQLIIKVRDMVFSKYAFQTSVTESLTLKNIEQSDSFVIDSLPIMDNYRNSDKFDLVSNEQDIHGIVVKKSKTSTLLPSHTSVNEEINLDHDAVASIEPIKGKKLKRKKRKSSNDVNYTSVISEKKDIVPEESSNKIFNDLKVNFKSRRKEIFESNTGLQNKICKPCSKNNTKEELCKNASSKQNSSSLNNTSSNRKNKSKEDYEIKVIEIDANPSEDNLTLPNNTISKNTFVKKKAVKSSVGDNVTYLEKPNVLYEHKNELFASDTLLLENILHNHNSKPISDSSVVCSAMDKSSLHAKLTCQKICNTNASASSDLNIEILPNDKFESSQLLNEHANIQNENEICAHISLSSNSSAKNLDISEPNNSCVKDAKSAKSLKKSGLKRKHLISSNFKDAYSREKKRTVNTESLNLKSVQVCKSDNTGQSLFDTQEESKENSVTKTKNVSSPVKATEKIESNESESEMKGNILDTEKYTSNLCIYKETIIEANNISKGKTLNISGSNFEHINESKACVINENSVNQVTNTHCLSLKAKCLSESEIFTNNLISNIDHPKNKTLITVSANNEFINKYEPCIVVSKISHMDKVECNALYSDNVHDKVIKEPETFIAKDKLNENSESKSLNVGTKCTDESLECTASDEINATNNNTKRKHESSDLNTNIDNVEMDITNGVITEVICDVLNKIMNTDSAECISEGPCITNSKNSEVDSDLEYKISDTNDIFTNFINKSKACTSDKLHRQINNVESIHSTHTKCINESRLWVPNSGVGDDLECEISNTDNLCTKFINESKIFITDHTINNVNSNLQNNIPAECNNESETHVKVNETCDIDDKKCTSSNIGNLCAEFINESEAYTINNSISEINTNTDTPSIDVEYINESEVYIVSNKISHIDKVECNAAHADDVHGKFIKEADIFISNDKFNENSENKSLNVGTKCINESLACIANGEISATNNNHKRKHISSDLNSKYINKAEMDVTSSVITEVICSLISKIININSVECISEGPCVTNTNISEVDNPEYKISNTNSILTNLIDKLETSTSDKLDRQINNLESIHNTHTECINESRSYVANDGISDDLECETSNTDNLCTKFINESKTFITDHTINNVNSNLQNNIPAEYNNESETHVKVNETCDIDDQKCTSSNTGNLCAEFINESEAYTINNSISEINANTETPSIDVEYINESEICIVSNKMSHIDKVECNAAHADDVHDKFNENSENKSLNVATKCIDESLECTASGEINATNNTKRKHGSSDLNTKCLNKAEMVITNDVIIEVISNLMNKIINIDIAHSECINKEKCVTNTKVSEVNNDLECKTSNIDDLCIKFHNESKTFIMDHTIHNINCNLQNKTVNTSNLPVECHNELKRHITPNENCDVNEKYTASNTDKLYIDFINKSETYAINNLIEEVISNIESETCVKDIDNENIETLSTNSVSTESITKSYKEMNISIKNILKEIVSKIDSTFNNSQKKPIKVVHSEFTDEISETLKESTTFLNNTASELPKIINKTQKISPKAEAVPKHIEKITLEVETKEILSNFSIPEIDKTHDSSISEDVCAVISSLKSNSMESCEKSKHLTSSEEYIDVLTVSDDGEHFQKLHNKDGCTMKEASFNLDLSVTSKEFDDSCSRQFGKSLDCESNLKSSNYVQFPHSSDNNNYPTFSDISMINKETNVENSDSKSPNQIRNFAFAATAEIFSSYRNDSISGDDKLSLVTSLKDDLSYCHELSNDGKSQNMSSDESCYKSDSEQSIDQATDQHEEALLENVIEASCTSEKSIKKNELSNVNEVQVDADASKFQTFYDNEERKLIDENSSVVILKSDIEQKILNETNKSRYSLRPKNKDSTVVGEILHNNSKKNIEIECDVSEANVNLRKDLNSEKNLPVNDNLKETTPICLVEDYFDLSQSSKCNFIESSPKKSMKRNAFKQSAMTPRRYSLRQQKSKLKTDDSSKLEIDLRQLHLGSPSSRKPSEENLCKNQMLIVKLSDIEKDLPKENIECGDLTVSCKHETRSSVAKSSQEESVPDSAGYNLRNRKSIITPAKLKIKI